MGRVEASNSIPTRKAVPNLDEKVPSPFSGISQNVNSVRRSLQSVNTSGPDNIPGRTLKNCADELAEVFIIFHYRFHWVPLGFKVAIILPIPKKSVVKGLNDYRPVALAPIVMKCFERLIKGMFVSSLPPAFDSFQFAYR